MVPFPCSLLQPVQAFPQSVYQVLFTFLYESFRLLHIYLLLEIFVQNCCLDIQLFDFEIHVGHNA